MPNGFEAFAQNAMALGETWRERRRQRKLADAMSQFDSNPDAAIAGVTRVDPVMGYNMRRQIQADASQAQEAARAKMTDTLKMVTGLLGPAANDPNATPESLGAAYDSIMPVLSDGLGMTPEEIVKWKQMFTTNPGILRNIDDQLRVVAPGSAIVRGNQEVYRNPYADQVIQVVRGDGGRDVIQVPRTYGGASQNAPGTGTPAPSFSQLNAPGGGVNIQPLMSALVAQESGGDTYARGIKTEYGRALGSTQMLPGTAREMATKLGLPWRPDLLRSKAPEAAEYQYALGQAYLQEGLEKYGGDVRSALMYYHGGPDEAKWGPKTRRYAREVLARLGVDVTQPMSFAAQPGQGGAQPARPGVFYSTPGKATSGPGGSVLSIEEVNELGLSPSVRWQRKNNGEIVPIGGANFLNKAIKQDQIYESITTNTQRMENAARALLNHPGLNRAAGINSYVPSVRGGKAADFERQLDAIKSQIGFTILNDMRQMSPTGGALGNVSNFEVDTLQRNIAALDVSQSPEQLRANIKQIMEYASNLRGRYQRAYKLDRSQSSSGGGQQRSYTAPPPQAIDMLRQNPSPQRRQQFDAIFGPGAAKRVLGGK